MNICVYCASSSVVDAVYFDAARGLGREIARRGHTLVYGAGNIGLMGALASEARAGGAAVHGVIPAFLKEKGLAYDGVTRLHVTLDMRQRKETMERLADGFIACPGGVGTFEEILEILTLKQLGQLNKACALLNANGYFDPLIAQFERGVSERFIKPKFLEAYAVTATPSEALDAIERYEPEALGEKWFTHEDIPARTVE